MSGKAIALLVAGGIGFFVFIWLLFSVTATVGTGQVGVVTRYGRVVGELQSGFHFKSPLTSVDSMSIQTQKDNVDAAASTKDLQQLDTNVNFNFHLLPSAVQTIFRTVGTGYDGTVIGPAIQEAVKANTAKYNADQEIENRPIVEQAITDELRSKLAPWGIVVDAFSIQNFGFSSQFNDAIEKKQVAQQQAQQAQYDLQTANLRAQANQAQQASLTDAILEQQAIQKWNGIMPTTVTAGATLFNIPVGK